MKFLAVGGGGREHAAVEALYRSGAEIYSVMKNANPGIISKSKEYLLCDEKNIEKVCAFAKEKAVDMAVIGPEVPLAMGIVDALEAVGVPAFGPNKKCAQLEASKSFTKAFLARHNIPTAKYSEYTDKAELEKAIGIYGYPMVIKADGLAAGKGVVLAQNAEEARKAIDDMMGEKVFGSAGDLVVVEECLTGIEASMLCFVDEHTIVPMESAQDYKRIFDNDEGPNTGGMGSYSPSLVFTDEVKQQLWDRILTPTLKGFQEDGLDFKGVLFVGLMISKDGPKVIEFNNRFGDPECQSVLMRMDTDLYDIFDAVINNRLSEIDIKWKDVRAVTIVLASEGYPGSYPKGRVITGLDAADGADDLVIFHAGTKFDGDDIVTSGGRVLGASALGKDHDDARARAYELAKKIHFDGAHFRKDIGLLHPTE